VQVETLARFVLPRIYGTWVEGNSWGPNSSLERGLADTTGYVSYVGLIFAGLAVLMTRKISLPVIITGIVALSLILALGDSTPLFRFFYLFVPGFSFFRSTARILSVYTLGLAVLGAIGFDKLQRKKISQKTVRMGLAISPLFFLGVGGIDLLYHSSQLLSPLKETVLAVTEFSPSKVDEVINLGMQSLILVGAGILGGLLFLIFSQTKKRLIFVIASALLVVELFFSVRGSLVFAPVEKTHAPEEIIRFLTDNLGEMRFISTGEIEPYTGIWVYFNHLVTRPPFSQEKVTDEELVSWDYLSRELAMLPANTNQFYQLKSSAGYVALMPNSYREFLQSSRMNSLDYRSWKNPLLNEMSTKYLITGIPIDVLKDSQSDQFELTLQIGDARIYQNKAAKPRAEFLVGGQPTPAQIVFLADDPNRVVLEVQNEAVGALVLRDFLYPGWQAVVNGSKREITPFEQIFRSVPLDSGKNQVAFSYHPKSFYNGVWLSLTSLLLIVILALVEKRRSLL
jgi:hypothetical protein